MTTITIRLAVAAALFATLSCASAAGRGAAPELEGPQWKLARLGNNAARGTTSQRPAYVRFIPDSLRLEGFGGCNRISGVYSRTGDLLSVGAIMSTRVACADDALNAQEREFSTVISEARRFSIGGDTLRLYDGSSVVRALLVR